MNTWWYIIGLAAALSLLIAGLRRIRAENNLRAMGVNPDPNAPNSIHYQLRH